MILIWNFKSPDITFAPRLLVNLSAFARFIPVTRMFQAKAESIIGSNTSYFLIKAKNTKVKNQKKKPALLLIFDF